MSFQNSTKILIRDEKLQGEGGEFTKNIVFKTFFYHNTCSFTFLNLFSKNMCEKFITQTGTFRAHLAC
jgi:hypothetical protein